MKFLQESVSYKAKLAVAEERIVELRQGGHGSSDSASSPRAMRLTQEIATLKFEKDALETKLRKYASYCQRLDNDKAQIEDALRSRKRPILDGDFTGAVVALCDELTGLEEECEVLANAERKASSYLMELDQLQDEKSSLAAQVEQKEKDLMELQKEAKDLAGRVQAKDAEIEILSAERERLSRSQQRRQTPNKDAELSRKVSYLEKENLQLMRDLKATKKSLQSTRSELDVLKMKGVGDDTEDFSALVSANRTKYAPPVRRTVLRPKDENQIKTTHAEKDTIDVPMTSVDKENGPVVSKNTAKDNEAMKKRRAARALRAQQRRDGSTPLGLGEPGPVDEENTGECTQS